LHTKGEWTSEKDNAVSVPQKQVRYQHIATCVARFCSYPIVCDVLVM